MEEKIIGILKNISELLVATVVSEDDTTIVVKDVAFLGIGGQNGQVNINFIPIEMLSLQPPVNIRNLLANPTQDLHVPINKASVLFWNLELSDNVVTNYKQLTNKSPIITPDKSIVKPDDNIVKLF
jgi:hypothetical protein